MKVDDDQRSNRIIDLMSRPFDGSGRLTRSGRTFSMDQAWTLADFGATKFLRGWWCLDCESDEDIGSVQIRLSSARDPLIVVPAQAKDTRIYLSRTETFAMSLLVSPWPGKRSFSRLRLRRLSITEELSLIARAVNRLSRRGNPIFSLCRLARRLIAGQAVGIQTSPATAAESVAAAREDDGVSLGAQRAIEKPKVIGRQGMSICLRQGDLLHTSALAIVSAEFERSPHLRAIYTDVEGGGVIRPLPQWSPDTADFFELAGAPLFLKGPITPSNERSAIDVCSIVRAHGPHSIGRIPLPLARRRYDASASTSLDVTIPALERLPRVSAIIPTKIQIDLLEKCLDGLVARTDYPDIEVVIVDNGSSDPRFSNVIAKFSEVLRLIMVKDHGDFNFARLINNGVKASSGEILLLLNDDVEPVEASWLRRIVQSVLAPEVGAVGARLIYPDGRIQHAGVIMGIGGVCGHLWKGTPPEAAARNPNIVLPGGRLAITGACLAVRRDVFDRAGGLDEKRFAVAFNDIDFCLRLHAAGLHNVYRGDAVLIHHESQSRGMDDASVKSRRRLASETGHFIDRWAAMLRNDPFGSPAFDQATESGAVHPADYAPPGDYVEITD